MEVWCGQSQGAIAIFSLKESIVTNQDIVNHPLDSGEVMQVSFTRIMNPLLEEGFAFRFHILLFCLSNNKNQNLVDQKHF